MNKKYLVAYADTKYFLNEAEKVVNGEKDIDLFLQEISTCDPVLRARVLKFMLDLYDKNCYNF